MWGLLVPCLYLQTCRASDMLYVFQNLWGSRIFFVFPSMKGFMYTVCFFKHVELRLHMLLLHINDWNALSLETLYVDGHCINLA